MLICSEQVDIVPLPGGALRIEHDGYEVIEGELAGRVLGAVYEGVTTRERLAAALGSKFGYDETCTLVEVMIRDGLLEDIASGVSEEMLRRWQQTQLPVQVIQEVLSTTGVEIHSTHKAAGLGLALTEWGIKTSGGELVVVDAAGLFCDQLARCNEQLLKESRPWMLVDGHELQQALFVPGRTGCVQCLRRALLDNRPGLDCVQGTTRLPTNLERAVFYERVAADIVKWLVAEKEAFAGRLSIQSGVQQPVATHAFVARYDCPACGKPETFNGDFARFSTALDEALNQTGKRAPATEAVLQFEHFVSPVTGVLRAPCVLPAVNPAAGFAAAIQHNMVHPTLQLDRLRTNTLGRSIGKGVSPGAASASAIFEGLERFSGIWRSTIAHEREKAHALPPEVRIGNLAGYSHRQYETREAWNTACDFAMLQVPVPFNPDKTIGWVAGYSLVNRQQVWVPAGYCFYDYPSDDGFLCDSNGCAAGTTYADAMLAGLCELIERDAVAIWWYNRAKRPRVILEELQDQWIPKQEAILKAQNRSLQVLDLTTDFEIPVVVAVSIDKNDQDDILLGFGCHWFLEYAVKGALLELNQVRTVRALSPHPAPLFNRLPGDERYWLEAEGLSKQAGFKNQQWPALKVLVDRFAKKGFDVLAVDQTHPDIGLPVIRMIVPGLCHHWRRFGVRRLYEAPVDMGWINNPNTEETLNDTALLL